MKYLEHEYKDFTSELNTAFQPIPPTLKKEDIKRVVYSKSERTGKMSTVVVWKDGTKTIVACQGDDVENKELGLAMAFSKKAFGNKSNYNEVFKEFCYV